MRTKAWEPESACKKTLVILFHSFLRLKSYLPFKAQPKKVLTKASRPPTLMSFLSLHIPSQWKGCIMRYVIWVLWALSEHPLGQCNRIHVSVLRRVAQGPHPLRISARWRFLFLRVLETQQAIVVAAKHIGVRARLLCDLEQVTCFLSAWFLICKMAWIVVRIKWENSHNALQT